MSDEFNGGSNPSRLFSGLRSAELALGLAVDGRRGARAGPGAGAKLKIATIGDRYAKAGALARCSPRKAYTVMFSSRNPDYIA